MAWTSTVNRALGFLRDNKPLILLIIVFGCILFPKLESAADSRVHMSFNFNVFHDCVKRIVDLGLFETRFGQPWGYKADGKVDYYINHPPLLSMYLLLSYVALTHLGWTAKAALTLVPTLFSLGSLAVTYLIGKRLFDARVAFASTLVMGFTPMFTAYSQLVCHEPPTTFFMLAILYAYINWFETQGLGDLRAMQALIVAGALTDWPAYYMIGLLGAHYLAYGKAGRLKFAGSLLILGLISFSIFLAHAYVLEGDNAFTKLKAAVNHRQNRDDATKPLDVVGGNINGFKASLDQVKLSNTPQVFYASGLFLAYIAYGLLRRKDTLRESYILVLILAAAIHNLLWPGGISYHDYWSYYFTPGLALAAVVGINNVIKGDRDYREFALWASLIGYWLVNGTYKLP